MCNKQGSITKSSVMDVCHENPQHFLSSFTLTHWGRDQIDAILQTTLSNAFSWMKILEFRLRFHWSLFLWVQLTIIQHWLRWWLGAVHSTSQYLNQWWLVYWRIYASLGLNELMSCFMSQVLTQMHRRLSYTYGLMYRSILYITLFTAVIS